MHWNADPVIVQLGSLELRYYGLLFALGLLRALGHVLSAPITIVCTVLVLGTRRFGVVPLLTPEPRTAAASVSSPPRPNTRRPSARRKSA